MLNIKIQIPYHIKQVLLMEVSFLTCNQDYVLQDRGQGIWTVFSASILKMDKRRKILT